MQWRGRYHALTARSVTVVVLIVLGVVLYGVSKIINMDVLDRDLLLTFATMAVKRLDQSRVSRRPKNRLPERRSGPARRHAAAARKESADRYSANVLPVITEFDGAGSNRCAARDGALEERELNVRDFAAALLRYSVEYRTSV
jgi:hypothetical protein